ncbi:MAG: rhodanese-like domain-containing protein [Psychroflexus sp.]|nr:rhodanese-like domain-containing protein [Psychroflexus sp.]MDR9449211.1 rhodanese-like domain-containing protein [Psychroflexus sp.]
MNNFNKLLISIVFMLASLFGFSQRDKAFTRLDVDTFKEKMNSEKSKVILDVRTPQEFKKGHLKNAKLINFYDQAFNSCLRKLDKKKTYFVYCASGIRSKKAANKLAELGVEKIFELKGGYNAWQTRN